MVSFYWLFWWLNCDCCVKSVGFQEGFPGTWLVSQYLSVI